MFVYREFLLQFLTPSRHYVHVFILMYLYVLFNYLVQYLLNKY